MATAARSSGDMNTLRDLLCRGASDAVALRAPGREPLDYAGLRSQVNATGAALAANGVGVQDRVAIVMPNGPEMTTLFLGVAAHAVAAPLNPGYRESEFDFYLDDLQASLLLVGAGHDTPAPNVARKRNIPVLTVEVPEGARAGQLQLTGGAGGEGEPAQPAAADPALVLHTSGTTSRPKIVPLTQANLAASATHIAQSLVLTEVDRCLSVMPQFHIHGLIASCLAPLQAGGSISCTPGFDALQFFRWLESEKPTWYTAVPTMHQAVLARGARQPEAARKAELRFLRSSSASLPPAVFKQLEELFACPVVESYGMTEATHQMTANPLGTGRQKPGTVGVAAGPQVRVADPDNRFLDTGEEGEIVICGPNVTPGYAGNAAANASSFFDDGSGDRWFRTGDQGVFDDDGYLRITGRIKEIINRGGEKIAPREVDDVLMEHPDIEQVVTFAVQHPRLGEEVAVAVVAREGTSPDAAAIRAFARESLADFKVPRHVVMVDEIPKGPTGKMQRIGLAKRLGLVPDEPGETP